MMEEYLPSRLKMPTSYLHPEKPVLRLDLDETESSDFLQHAVLDTSEDDQENLFRAYLSEVIDEFHTKIRSLSSEMAMLRVDNRNLRKQALGSYKRSYSTSSWYSIYIYKSIEASFDDWQANRVYSEFPFRMLRNAHLKEGRSDFHAPLAILPCLPHILHAFSDPNACVHCSCEDIVSIDLPEDEVPEVQCDVEFLVRFHGGKLPSILIVAQVIKDWKEASALMSDWAEDAFKISSTKLLLGFLLLVDQLDHPTQIAIFAVDHLDPTTYAVLAVHPKVEGSTELCVLDVEGITYSDTNSSKHPPWQLDLKLILAELRESMFGYLYTSSRVPAAAGGEDHQMT